MLVTQFFEAAIMTENAFIINPFSLGEWDGVHIFPSHGGSPGVPGNENSLAPSTTPGALVALGKLLNDKLHHRLVKAMYGFFLAIFVNPV